MSSSPLPPITPPVSNRGASLEPQLVLSIEGNIGIGKSTLLGNLRQRFAKDPEVVFVDEPVEVHSTHSRTVATLPFFAPR